MYQIKRETTTEARYSSKESNLPLLFPQFLEKCFQIAKFGRVPSARISVKYVFECMSKLYG